MKRAMLAAFALVLSGCGNPLDLVFGSTGDKVNKGILESNEQVAKILRSDDRVRDKLADLDDVIRDLEDLETKVHAAKGTPKEYFKAKGKRRCVDFAAKESAADSEISFYQRKMRAGKGVSESEWKDLDDKLRKINKLQSKVMDEWKKSCGLDD